MAPAGMKHVLRKTGAAISPIIRWDIDGSVTLPPLPGENEWPVRSVVSSIVLVFGITLIIAPLT
jgi:hypothetical protein